MGEYVKVASASAVPAGTAITIEVGGKPVALINSGGTFYAIDDTCPHQGGPLGEGEIDGTTVTCPWHEWRYDVRTGVNVDDDACRVATYNVKVEGDDVLIES
jgi:nitrite reductase/ring-hydroxylating ferredoxin subunit